jgi:hypothetical protein
LSKAKKINAKALAVIALMIIGISSIAVTLAALTASQNFSSSGTVSNSPNLGVYSDSACTIPLTTIQWGNISAGTNIQRTIYVKNTSSGCSLALSMTTSNWSFVNNGNITLTWDKEGVRLNPGASTAAVFTLTVSPTIIDVTTFSVQISITGTN